MKRSKILEDKVTRMIQILQSAKEDNWVKYFESVLKVLEEGRLVKGKKEIIGAYGGMGSFNDIALSFIDEETYQEALALRKDLYTLSNNITLFQRLFA